MNAVPPNLCGQDGPCFRPPDISRSRLLFNISRSTVIGCEVIYEVTKKSSGISVAENQFLVIKGTFQSTVHVTA